MFGSAALVAIAVLVCCLMGYTVYVQRRAFARVHAYSNALNQQAAQDTLTGLPNRRRLLSTIDALSNDAAASGRIALLYLDIDGFKNVNDAMGHSAGDVLLRRLAESLRTATRQNDMLARVGGDEFVLLATDCGEDAKLRELADRLVSSVRAVGDKEYGGRFAIGVSIGIATFPDRVQTIAGLLDVADAAMYVAKRSGRSTYSFGSSPGPGLSNVVKLTR
jgi:diguanylate cyclase (GGDEF)-like protein